MSRTQIWLQAFRLHTLPLAFACIALGNFLAYFSGKFHPVIAIATFITALALQILSNLANDYGDTRHGADNESRVGPKRMVQAGMISKQQIKNGVVIFSLLSFISGSLLLILSIENIGYRGAMLLLLVGLLSIAAAIAYTATKNPYGYHGLGDISVFIFFGLVAVIGSYYLQAGHLPGIIFLPASGMGLLSTAVLNVNNIRDIEADTTARKRTIAVRLGLKAAKAYHWALLLGSLLLFSLYTFFTLKNQLQWLFLLPGALFLLNGIGISKSEQPHDINPYLRQLVISILAFSLIYGIGLVLF